MNRKNASDSVLVNVRERGSMPLRTDVMRWERVRPEIATGGKQIKDEEEADVAGRKNGWTGGVGSLLLVDANAGDEEIVAAEDSAPPVSMRAFLLGDVAISALCCATVAGLLSRSDAALVYNPKSDVRRFCNE